jgi:hypothetical protein
MSDTKTNNGRFPSADETWQRAGFALGSCKLSESDQKDVDRICAKYGESLRTAKSLPHRVKEERYNSQGSYLSDLVFEAIRAKFLQVKAGDTCAYVVRRETVTSASEDYRGNVSSETNHYVVFDVAKFA